MSTLRLEIRKGKIDKKGMAPVYLVYQVSGKKTYYSTGVKSYPENWDISDQKFIYIRKGNLLKLDADELNKQLYDLISKIRDVEKRFELNDTVYSPSMVFADLNKKPTTKPDASDRELFSFIDKYIEDHRLLRVKGSLSVYRSLKSHLEGYEQATRKKVLFEKIDFDFFQSFQNYLVGLRRVDKAGNASNLLNNITIAKLLSTLKTFINYAKKRGIVVNEGYRNFSIKRETDLEVISLTKDEFLNLYNLDLSGRRAWDRVRDLFCFSCVTGLRFSDLQQLRHEHIKDDYLEMTAIKTTHRTAIPLNPFSRAILKKYADQVRPLPTITNQKANLQLAKICKFAGIDESIEIVRKHGATREATKYAKHELVRMHCGRKTFATLSLEAGMSAEYVMRIGGWKDYKSFKRYMNLSDESTKNAMKEAWGSKIFMNKLKAV